MNATATRKSNSTVPVECPACSNPKATEVAINGIAVYRCTACGAIHSSHINLGNSYAVVSPAWDASENPTEVYFDFSGVSSKGLYRRHGWYNPATGKITQVG